MSIEQFINLVGRKFGYLTVVANLGKPGYGKGYQYLCRCVCGKEKVIYATNLTSGTTTGCSRWCPRRKRVPAVTKMPEYHSWIGMKMRCHAVMDSHYHEYGGRGIVVCERWRHSFGNFLADIGPRPGPGYSLDRIDFNGNYEPTNCRWATKKKTSWKPSQ